MPRRTAAVLAVCAALLLGGIIVVAIFASSGPNPQAVSCNVLGMAAPGYDDNTAIQGQVVPAEFLAATARPVPRSTGGAARPATTGGARSTGGSTARSTTGAGTGTARPKGANTPQANVPTPPAGQQKRTIKGEKSYTPPRGNVPQPRADIDAVERTIPSSGIFRLSRTQGYLSPVTGHVYMWHNDAYFASLGWHDPYDPYDPWNWSYHSGWYSPFGPGFVQIYGAHVVYVDRC